MSRFEIRSAALSAEAFAPFGDVLDRSGTPDVMINGGLCGRHNDRAQLDFGDDGRAGISVFDAEPRALPYTLDLMERHPLGSQAFLPMHRKPFLITVALDEGGQPGHPLAFITAPGQGINFHKGTWHGVLTPLQHPGAFAVVDRIGEGNNLQEHLFDTPYVVVS